MDESAPVTSNFCRVPDKILVNEDDESKDGNTGLELRGSFQRVNEQLILELQFKNTTAIETLEDFALKFNVNTFGLKPAQSIPEISVEPGKTKKVSIKIDVNENNNNKAPETPLRIESALKTSIGVFVFTIP